VMSYPPSLQRVSMLVNPFAVRCTTV
jgi:hypothetical protein